MTSRRYFAHAGPDAMLREASDVSLAHIYREIAEMETKYSINELELLAVIWSVEHFQN